MDSDREQSVDRDAQSISDDNQSLQDLNYIIDQLEREQMESLSLDIVSSPDEELKVDWEISRTPSPDITITPDVSSQPYLLETDVELSVESVSSPPPPSLDSFFPCSLIEDSAFSIEKVLGPTTANILAEAEAEASKYADGLQNLEVPWSEDTNEPHRLLTCQICQLFVRTVDRLLDKSEQLMDHYLPLTEEEIENLKKAVQELEDSSTDHEMQVCFARISNLSGKLRQRAYMMALSKLRLARKSTEENLAQLQQTIDLIGQVQRVDAMDYQKSFEKLTEISIQWCQRQHSFQQQSMGMKTETLSLDSSIGESGLQRAQSSANEDVGVCISISSKVEEKQESLDEGESAEMAPVFSTEIQYMEEIEYVRPPYASSEKVPEIQLEVPPSLAAEVEPEVPPPEEVEPEVPPGPPEEIKLEVTPSTAEQVEPEVPPSPPAEVEPEVPPPEEVEAEVPPPEEVEPEVPPPEEVELEVPPPEEVEPEVPPGPPEEIELEVTPSTAEQVEPEVPPPEEVEPEVPPPEEVEPEVPPSPPAEVEAEVPPPEELEAEVPPPEELEAEVPPPEELEAEVPPPEELEPEVPPPEEVEPEVPPPEEVEPEVPPPEEVEPEVPPPEEVEPELPPIPPEEVEPEVLRSPEEVEPEVPPSPPTELELEVPGPPEEVEPEVLPRPPAEIEPEIPPTLPAEIELEVPSPPEEVPPVPSPPPEVEPEKPPTPPPEVEPEKPPTPPPEVEPKKPPTPPPEVTRPPLTPLPQEEVHRDVALITLTAPGCEEDDLLLRMARSEEDVASAIEAKTLEMSRSLTSNLKNTYESLLTNLKDLPSNLQNKLYQTCHDMSELHSTFASAHCFSDLSTGLLNKSFAIMAEAQGSMDELMEFALQSPKALLWLKDYFPPIVTKKDGAESKDEAEEGLPPFDMRDTESNILKIQKVYDPGECYDDTLFVKKKEESEEVPSFSFRESEDIIKIQEAYDPQGCKEDVTPSCDEEEVPSASKEESKNWGIMKMLETYVPKIPSIQALKKHISASFQKQEEEVPAQEEEEVTPSREDILKLLRDYEPKGCEDTFDEIEIPDSDQREFFPQSRENILKLLQDYDPQECFEDRLPSKEEKEEMEVLQISIEKAPSMKKVAFPPPVQKEEVISPAVHVGAVPPAVQVDVVPSGAQLQEVPSRIQAEMPSVDSISTLEVPSTMESGLLTSLDNILKVKINENNNNNEVPKGPLTAEEEKQPPPPEKPKNLLDTQKAYEPKECEDGSAIRRQAEEASSSAARDQVDILKIQRAYDLKECEEMIPGREAEEEASPTSGGQEWSIFKLVQSYLPKSLKNYASSKKEEDE